MAVEQNILICDLEKINEIIDLCIDRELYKHLNKILSLSNPAKKYFETLSVNKRKGIKPLKLRFEDGDLPVQKVNLPSKLIPPQLILSKESSLNLAQKTNQATLLKRWSYLFWSKRIRAVLHKKNNKGAWLKRYDDLILFLERHIPTAEDKANNNKKDFILTLFNYLMELSALAQGEASFGYAERAQKVLNELYRPEPDEPERGPYDRWISWNKGTAYQHIGRNQRAAIEFNWVIKKFWEQKLGENDEEIKNVLLNGRESNSARYIKIVLEFLVNIVPAYLQRAAVNLQLQLGYHALQTLDTLDGRDKFLKKISEDNLKNLFAHAANHLQRRIDLLRIEALLQLGRIDMAQKRLTIAYKNIFDDDKWDPENFYIPRPDNNPTAIKTQLIEQTVSWLLEREKKENNQDNCEAIIKNIQKLLSNSPKIEDRKELRDKFKKLSERADDYDAISTAIKKTYWEWAKDNQFDELIYFSKWAQLLKHWAILLKQLDKLTNPSESSEREILNSFVDSDISQQLNDTARFILNAIISFYCCHREKLPVCQKATTNKSGKKNKIDNRLRLQQFRSDDRPDFVGGLNVFYKQMCSILLSEKDDNDIINFKEIALEIFKREGKNNPFDLLKEDHFQLLDALDEHEVEFGENQQIKSLKRCNEREIWFKNSEMGCKECLDIKNINAPEKPYYFDGLLVCHVEPVRNDDVFLYREDYKNIMQKAEDLFIKHLHSPSLQNPAQKAVHFVGLQRWNSLTPAQGRSVGGGYLIYRTDKYGRVDLGIAVDPGFDFVRNLFRMGFSLRDIDIVIISHAHPDHLWDFETMVQLLHELEDKKNITHRLNVIMTLGSYKRLGHIIKNPKLRSFINPLVVDILKEVDRDFFREIDKPAKFDKYSFRFFENKKEEENEQNAIRWRPVLPLPDKLDKPKGEIEIRPTRAYHEDYTEISDSFGFLINIFNEPGSSDLALSFGYTSDTKWVGDDLYSGCPVHKKDCINCSDVASQYKKCDVLLMHIGSLIDHKKGESFEKYKRPDKCVELIRKENHLYLMGTIRFLKKLGYPEEKSVSKDEKQKLILLGEFGEELRGGIRTDLVKRLQGEETHDWPILPVDVGFDVLLYDYNRQTNYNLTNNKGSDDGFKFLCALCDEHRPIEEIDYYRFGQDEAIFHMCKTCKKATPADVRQTRLRHLYEIGRELQTLPDSFQ